MCVLLSCSRRFDCVLEHKNKAMLMFVSPTFPAVSVLLGPNSVWFSDSCSRPDLSFAIRLTVGTDATSDFLYMYSVVSLSGFPYQVC